MAEKTAGHGGLPPEAGEVARLIAKGNSKSAVEQAKLIHKRFGTPATEGLLVDAYSARIRPMLEHRLTAEAEALAATVRQKYPASAGRLSGLREAVLTAGAGLDEMLRPLADPSAPAEAKAAAEAVIRATLVDLGPLAESKALDPEHPLRRGAGAIRRALDAATSGLVDDAALALPEISRRSPLAPWKPLVRAIACYYRYEDAACREQLEAIDADSAPARLKPALEALLGGGGGKSLPAAATALAKGVSGSLEGLRAALGSLERAFEEGQRKPILDGIRTVFALAQQECPEVVTGLRRQVAVRAMLEDLAPGPVVAAMGGPPKNDARYHLAQARAVETMQRHPLGACHCWENFRRAAIQEKWFGARGPEAAVLYVHMAELADSIDEEDLVEEYQTLRDTFRREASEGFDASAPGMQHLHAEWLLEQACAMDPTAEAFLSWVKWAERSKPAAVEAAAQAWHKALPDDPRPLIRLMEQAEKRNALKKAMGYLRQAESIDGVNAEVRRARLRLLILGAVRHIKQSKPHLAEAELKELEALPQARENDRPAFVAALRTVAAIASKDATGAQASSDKVNQLMGSPRAGAIVISAAGMLCGMKLGVKYAEAPGSWVEAVCRA
ncbi:MAG: hypothetical protein NTY38_13215, partial [Acidobacteria bacterium]|nr:hypothetical protein [Acidobacteriota bacterium]